LKRAKPMKASGLSIKPTVLKLGGSVITHKDKPFTANLTAIRRLAAEIAEAKIPQLIVVHGGGSFGHTLAKEYAIREGYRGEASQLLGFTKTHQAMITLNNMVLEALIQHNIPAMTIAASSFVVSKSGRIKTITYETLKRLLNMGSVPLLYGDAVLDFDKGFTILSGDQLVASIAIHFGAERIVVGIDEDGLFTTDPKKPGRHALIRKCTLSKLRRLQGQIKSTNICDVTGGMYGKITELMSAVEEGIPTLIVNGAKPNRIYKALRGEKIIGTLFQRG
jgi:isopentenyl phosphate kinase